MVMREILLTLKLNMQEKKNAHLLLFLWGSQLVFRMIYQLVTQGGTLLTEDNDYAVLDGLDFCF